MLGLEAGVCRRPADTGLLLSRRGHVDEGCGRSLLKAMLGRAFRLSSTWESFKSECDHLKVIFTNFKYSDSPIKSTICHFVTSVRSENPA